MVYSTWPVPEMARALLPLYPQRTTGADPPNMRWRAQSGRRKLRPAARWPIPRHAADHVQRILVAVISIGGLALIAFPDQVPIASGVSAYWRRTTGGGLLLIGLFLVWAPGS